MTPTLTRWRPKLPGRGDPPLRRHRGLAAEPAPLVRKPEKPPVDLIDRKDRLWTFPCGPELGPFDRCALLLPLGSTAAWTCPLISHAVSSQAARTSAPMRQGETTCCVPKRFARRCFVECGGH